VWWILSFHSHLQGLSYNPGEYEFESGQMVINRGRVWDALLVAAEINRRYTSYYRFMYAAVAFVFYLTFTRSIGTATKTHFGSLSK